MDTYVLRIYRLPKETSHLVLGLVERVGTDRSHRFSSFDELREIITRGSEPRPEARKEERCCGAGEEHESAGQGEVKVQPGPRARAAGRRRT